MAAEFATQLRNPNDDSNPFTLVHLINVTKLTSTNYLNWKLQIEAALDGYDLLGYVDGSITAPDITTTTGTPPVTQPNPAYRTWKRQDRLVYSALLGTLSPSVCSLVTQAKSSHDVWTTLQQTFGRASRGHIKQLKEKLRNTEKGTLSISEYMNSVKVTADLLAALGSPVHAEDLTDHVLRGLDDGYQPVVDGVQARDTPISFEELHEKLIQRELSIKFGSKCKPGPAP